MPLRQISNKLNKINVALYTTTINYLTIIHKLYNILHIQRLHAFQYNNTCSDHAVQPGEKCIERQKIASRPPTHSAVIHDMPKRFASLLKNEILSLCTQTHRFMCIIMYYVLCSLLGLCGVVCIFI